MEQEKCNKPKIPYFKVAADFKEMEQNDREYYQSFTPEERIESMFFIINQLCMMKNIKPEPLRKAKLRIITQEELNNEPIGF